MHESDFDRCTGPTFNINEFIKQKKLYFYYFLVFRQMRMPEIQTRVNNKSVRE